MTKLTCGLPFWTRLANIRAIAEQGKTNRRASESFTVQVEKSSSSSGKATSSVLDQRAPEGIVVSEKASDGKNRWAFLFDAMKQDKQNRKEL